MLKEKIAWEGEFIFKRVNHVGQPVIIGELLERYDHKIETSLEGIEHLSREKKEEKERKMKKKLKNHYYLRDTKLLDF